MTPVQKVFFYLDEGMLTPERRAKLLEEEKELLMQVYNLDPELMKVKYANPSRWYFETFSQKKR